MISKKYIKHLKHIIYGVFTLVKFSSVSNGTYQEIIFIVNKIYQ